MAELPISSRLRLQRAARRSDRGARRARLMQSPLLRWLRAPGCCDEIVLVPSDLRTPDPTFADEARAGWVGLGGETVRVGSGSPFAGSLGSAAWQRELHGFGWLNHLAQSGAEGRVLAQRLVSDWIARGCGRLEIAAEVAVTARRVISWITHSGLVADEADPSLGDSLLRSLGQQLDHLEAERRAARPGADNLRALIALLLADVCIADREVRRVRSERLLAGELSRQILADGGHVSRNPAIVLELLLDLLPLRRCYAASSLPVPAVLAATIDAMLDFLGAMRLGDGSLGCFNGTGTMRPDALATVLAVHNPEHRSELAASGYVRLVAGELVLLMDVGATPPIELTREAAAGCLSIEISDGEQALIVNCGVTTGAVSSDRVAARATAAHSTLGLAERSSGRLVEVPRFGMVGAEAALIGPRSVTLKRGAAMACEIEASHDGYIAPHGMIHTRVLALSAAGDRIDGVDRLAGHSGEQRLAKDLPFAIRFHLAPGCDCGMGGSTTNATVQIRLPDGRQWQLAAKGAEIGLEASGSQARGGGLRPARQIVLRGATHGATTVSWSLARVEGPSVTGAA